MIDLRVIEVRALLTIAAIEPVAELEPRTIRLLGPDLSSTAEVFINERPSPSIFVQSARQVLAQVPTELGGRPIRTVVAVSHKVSNTARSKIQFTLGNNPGYIAGTERLIQSFVKLLLQSPGSDQFAPQLGGGVLRAVGRIGRERGAGTLVAEVQTAVDRTRGQLLALQARESNLTPEEKLLYARLLKADFSVQEGALFCSIDIASQAMRSTVMALEV